MKKAISSLVLGAILSTPAFASTLISCPGCTLYQLAKKANPSPTTLTTQQVMVAIFDNNKKAFITSNLNSLKASSTLKIPSATVIKKIPASKAFQTVSKDNLAWEKHGKPKTIKSLPLTTEPSLAAAEPPTRSPLPTENEDIAPAKPSTTELSPETSFAADNGNKPGHFYLGTALGVSLAKIGDDQEEHSSTGRTVAKYVSNTQYFGTPAFSINGGYEFFLQKQFLLDLGIEATHAMDHTSKGEISQLTSGDTYVKGLKYQYNVKTTRLMAEMRLAMQLNHIIPFVDCGIGPSWNYSNSYEERSIDSSSQPGNNFNSYSKFDLAYKFGGGLMYQFNNNKDRITFNYNYVNSGKAYLDPRVSAPSFTLNVGNVTSHETMVGYMHFFDN